MLRLHFQYFSFEMAKPSPCGSLREETGGEFSCLLGFVDGWWVGLFIYFLVVGFVYFSKMHVF